MRDKEKFSMAVTLLCEINEEARNEELKGIINDLYEFDVPENWRYMKKSILDYVIKNGIWDSEDSSCPGAENFEEFDEETGRWCLDEFSREDQTKIGKYGIFIDYSAGDSSITRFVTRDWIQTEAKEFYYDDETDWGSEADKAGEWGSNYRYIDRANARW